MSTPGISSRLAAAEFTLAWYFYHAMMQFHGVSYLACQSTFQRSTGAVAQAAGVSTAKCGLALAWPETVHPGLSVDSSNDDRCPG